MVIYSWENIFVTVNFVYVGYSFISDTLIIHFSYALVVSILKRPRTPPATQGMVDYQSPNPDHEQLMKRLRPAHSVEEVTKYCSLERHFQ